MSTLSAQREALKTALADPRLVAERLGLLQGSRPQHGGGLTVHCVWHDERTPSLSLFTGPDGSLGAKCHGCGAGGSVFDLIAAVHGSTLPRDMREVLQHAAHLAGTELVDAPARALPPAVVREPPPLAEVETVLAQGRRVESDLEARRWLHARGLDPLACSGLCRVIMSAWPSWARAGSPPRPWSASAYRLIVPVYDALGALRSLRARRVKGSSGPKELPPLGCRAAGYVYANRHAVAMLRGVPSTCVLVVEGTPDYLTWSSRCRWPVIGLPGSGAWSRELADKIPDGAEVVVRTDPDDAGDRYAAIVAQHLADRCRVLVSDAAGRARRRALCVGGRGSGLRGEDENDRLRAGTLPADPREGCEAA